MGERTRIHEYRSICTRCADIRGGRADTSASVCAVRRSTARVHVRCSRVERNGVYTGSRGVVCRCLVTRQESPWGLNTVCTSVVRELDPMWARTSYQLIFHERALGYVPGLPNTERNPWKLVIRATPLRREPSRAEPSRFIFHEEIIDRTHLPRRSPNRTDFDRNRNFTTEFDHETHEEFRSIRVYISVPRSITNVFESRIPTFVHHRVPLPLPEPFLCS